MRAPSRGGSVENVIERHQGGSIQAVELDPMLVEKLDPLERTASRLLSVPERLPIVHRTKRDLGMNLAEPRVRSSEFRHVQDPSPERMRLRGDTESGSERCLEDLSRRSRENGAGSSSQERARRGIRLSRAEADRDVDGDDRRVRDFAEVCFYWRQDVVCDQTSVLKDDRDPPALCAIDARDLHSATV